MNPFYDKTTATPERFVSAEEAARHLGITRRFLLSIARRGIAGAYAIGTGDFRKTWIFKLSEVDAAIDPKAYDPHRQSPLK